MKLPEAGSSIKQFIERTITETEVALLGHYWELKKPIELELSAIAKGKSGGGFDLQIVNFGVKVEEAQLQKIKLAIGPKTDVDEAEKSARISKAKKEEMINVFQPSKLL
ncbi:hypothetical protein J4482_01560 [Candidatus Woesearchaeota archaeon]|nr:hypothetical protein [uncultured archaeon]AQS32102.1 hypothetical protein [uncultured archaeon]MBS3115296.1 hypothetical protein [Candidatus Woesearchaeota archaeon]